jgi:hypothetical protein
MARGGQADMSEQRTIDQEVIRRKHPFTRQCTSCGADIVWFRTSSGKRMPVDEATTKPNDAEHMLDLKRHISHFATCPEADKWRKSR